MLATVWQWDFFSNCCGSPAQKQQPDIFAVASLQMSVVWPSGRNNQDFFNVNFQLSSVIFIQVAFCGASAPTVAITSTVCTSEVESEGVQSAD